MQKSFRYTGLAFKRATTSSRMPSWVVGREAAKLALLSNGPPEIELKREFYISAVKKALFRTIGARRWLRGPARSGPTTLLLSTPMAMDCVSPKPAGAVMVPIFADEGV